MALFSNIALKYCHEEGSRNPGCLKLNGTYKLKVCTDDVHLLDQNVSTIKENRRVLLSTNKEDSVEVQKNLTICSCLIKIWQKS
jgi:hypothetical protein